MPEKTEQCEKCSMECPPEIIHAKLNQGRIPFDKCLDYTPRQTNADRIRSMSDDELAATMMCPNESGLAEIECDRSDNCNCYECLLKWLQLEVEESD